MELFFVVGNVAKRKHEQFYVEHITDMRNVRALNEENARKKWEKYWTDQTVDESIYYIPELRLITPVLE